MIIKEITFGELAQCYFPNMIQSEAARKLQSYLIDINPYFYETIREKIVSNGILEPNREISYRNIVIIGMSLGFPRKRLVEDVRDTITWGYNDIYSQNHPHDKVFISESFRKLDSRLDPPLEIFDCPEMKEES